MTGILDKRLNISTIHEANILRKNVPQSYQHENAVSCCRIVYYYKCLSSFKKKKKEKKRKEIQTSLQHSCKIALETFVLTLRPLRLVPCYLRQVLSTSILVLLVYTLGC